MVGVVQGLVAGDELVGFKDMKNTDLVFDLPRELG